MEEIDLETAWLLHVELREFIGFIGFERLDYETFLKCVEVLNRFNLETIEIFLEK